MSSSPCLSNGATRPTQPAPLLQSAVPCRLGDLARDRRRPTPSRRTHRCAGGAAYLDSDLATSSPPPLSRPCRRSRPRQLLLDLNQARILPACARAQPHLPRQAAGLSLAGLCAKPTTVPRRFVRTVPATRVPLPAA